MKLGIKVGPRQQSITDLDLTQAAICEVWFDIHQLDNYLELFNDLKQRTIDVGLHFWGLTNSGALANIAYPDQTELAESLALIHQTIDIAAQYGFDYVNIHPGSSANVAYDFANDEFTLKSSPIDLNSSTELFLEHAKTLYDYATRQGIVFTVETVPLFTSKRGNYPTRRLHPDNMYQLPISAVIEAAKIGIPVANDLSHTTGTIVADSQAIAWDWLKKQTLALLPYTRLIHLGFTVPPFNGTDNHDMLDNPILDTGRAVPNKKQMIELLKLFRNRSDVWVITEPKEDHVKNYFLAKKIIDMAEK